MDVEKKHTPGPWRVLPEEEGVPYIRIRAVALGQKYKIANVLLPDWGGASESDIEEARQNARRIVACLNACRGVPTDALERSSIIDLIHKAEKQ